MSEDRLFEKKAQPVVHHDIDTWLTKVEKLKKELKDFKDTFAKIKEKKKKEFKEKIKSVEKMDDKKKDEKGEESKDDDSK